VLLCALDTHDPALTCIGALEDSSGLYQGHVQAVRVLRRGLHLPQPLLQHRDLRAGSSHTTRSAPWYKSREQEIVSETACNSNKWPYWITYMTRDWQRQDPCPNAQGRVIGQGLLGFCDAAAEAREGV